MIKPNNLKDTDQTNGRRNAAPYKSKGCSAQSICSQGEPWTILGAKQVQITFNPSPRGVLAAPHKQTDGDANASVFHIVQTKCDGIARLLQPIDEGPMPVLLTVNDPNPLRRAIGILTAREIRIMEQ